MPPSDHDLLDLTMNTDCYRALDDAEHAKVDKALAGQPASTPRSNLGKVAFYLARRLHPVSPPPPSLAELGRNVMFTAWDPVKALRCPPHWRVAVSADPAYELAVRAAAPQIKQHGNLLAVWGVQTQVGAERIKTLGKELGADFLIFQAETPPEYDTAIKAGAQLIVGNPNSWTQAQRNDAIARGHSLGTLFEVYSNEGAPWPDTASSQGVPITCEVLGVGWGANPYQLPEYRPHTPDGVWQTISVYLAENMSDESWKMLP